MKVEFQAGCFDRFEGTQTELDAVVQRIHDITAFGCCSRAIDIIIEPFGATAFEIDAVMLLMAFDAARIRH